MTLEELKIEADKLGYHLVKKPVRESFLPCTCGSNRRHHWINGAAKEVGYTCIHCKRKSSGKTWIEAKKNWNKDIRSVEDDNCCVKNA